MSPEARPESSPTPLPQTAVRQLSTFIELHNNNLKPFKWTKSADQILASVKRFCHKAQQTLCDEL
jgi:DNA segregation ATPase FtsK/SpoIIIE-like protein